MALHCYGKCSKILNTSLSVLKWNISYKGWNSQHACQNSEKGSPWSESFLWSSLICIFTIYLGPFCMQLVFKILEHFWYSRQTNMSLNVALMHVPFPYIKDLYSIWPKKHAKCIMISKFYALILKQGRSRSVGFWWRQFIKIYNAFPSKWWIHFEFKGCWVVSFNIMQIFKSKQTIQN